MTKFFLIIIKKKLTILKLLVYLSGVERVSMVKVSRLVKIGIGGSREGF